MTKCIRMSVRCAKWIIKCCTLWMFACACSHQIVCHFSHLSLLNWIECINDIHSIDRSLCTKVENNVISLYFFAQVFRGSNTPVQFNIHTKKNQSVITVNWLKFCRSQRFIVLELNYDYSIYVCMKRVRVEADEKAQWENPNTHICLH